MFERLGPGNKPAMYIHVKGLTVINKKINMVSV